MKKNCEKKKTAETQNDSSISTRPSPRFRLSFLNSHDGYVPRCLSLRLETATVRREEAMGELSSAGRDAPADKKERRRRSQPPPPPLLPPPRDHSWVAPRSGQLRLSVDPHLPCVGSCCTARWIGIAARHEKSGLRSGALFLAPLVDWHRRRSRLSRSLSFLSLHSHLSSLPSMTQPTASLTAIVKARDLRSKSKAELEGQVRRK